MKEKKIELYHLHKNQPDKLQFELYSLKDYLSESYGHAEKPHIHSFYQIIWFAKEGGKHYVDFEEYNIIKNSLFFIPKGQMHYFDNNPHDGHIMHFNEEFLAAGKSETDLFLKHNIFNSFENEPFFIIDDSNVECLHSFLQQMQQEMHTPLRFGHKDFLKHLLYLFLIMVQRLGRRNENKRLSVNNPHHILFIKFRQLLEVNFKKMHTVAEYAALLHVSTKTLTNNTKEISSQTPLDIINDRIILEAKRLLIHSSSSISEIGFELGFIDPSYFIKYFRRHTTLSPKDFRININR